MTIKQKLITGLVTGIFASSVMVTGAFADITVGIHDNGRNSDNDVTVNANQSTYVSQTNVSEVVNSIGVSNSTGGNTANDNVGDGDVSVKSGNAVANISVTNKGNSNDATVNPCGCEQGDIKVKIAENGRNSDNTVTVNNNNKLKVSQTNVAYIVNSLSVLNKTGKNKANDNVGDGSVDVESGKARANITVKNFGGKNTLNP